MAIESFTFRHNDTEWHLEETSFGSFTLLVGPSGTGKTRILQALHRVCQVGAGRQGEIGNSSWTLRVSTDLGRFEWSATTLQSDSAAISGLSAGRLSQFSRWGDIELFAQPDRLTHEIVTLDNTLLVERVNSNTRFRGAGLPRMKETESLISLFREDLELKSLWSALDRVTFTQAIDGRHHFDHITGFKDRNSWIREIESNSDLEVLRNQGDWSLTTRAYVLQRQFPAIYDRICRRFMEMFPSVTDLKVGFLDTFIDQPGTDESTLYVGITEQGIRSWITSSEMSSGMLRALRHLFEIELLPEGSVVLVDEYENGLGVNCLDEVLDHLRSRRGVQFILTSHHPYVINNIPLDLWKVVSRKGGEVTVRECKDIPGLKGASRQDAFVRLLNVIQDQEAP